MLFSQRRFALLALALSLGPASTANESTHFYPVSGLSIDALRRDMSEKTPVRLPHGRFDAQTTWVVRWQQLHHHVPGWCQLSQLDVSLKINTTLPRWQDEYRADPQLVSTWSRYINALFSHEHRHAEHGRQAAAEIRALGNQHWEASDCQLLTDEINTAAQNIVSKYQQKDRAYDLMTRHGAEEGAVFPPPSWQAQQEQISRYQFEVPAAQFR